MRPRARNSFIDQRKKGTRHCHYENIRLKYSFTCFFIHHYYDENLEDQNTPPHVF
jgi:hypothetical protein